MWTELTELCMRYIYNKQNMFPRIDDGRECRLKLLKVYGGHRLVPNNPIALSHNERSNTSQSTIKLKQIHPRQNKILIKDMRQKGKKCTCCNHQKKYKNSNKFVIKKHISSSKSHNNIGQLLNSASQDKVKERKVISVVNVEDQEPQYAIRKIDKGNEHKNQDKWVNKIIKKIFEDKKTSEYDKSRGDSKIIQINGRYYQVVNQSNNNSNLILLEQQKQKDELEHQQREEWQQRASDKLKFRQYLDNQVTQYLKYQTIFNLIKIGKYTVPDRQNSQRYMQHKNSVSQRLSLCHDKQSSQDQGYNDGELSNSGIDQQLKKNYYNQCNQIKQTYMIKFPTLENVDEMIDKYESLTGWMNIKSLINSKEYYREYCYAAGKQMLYFGCWDSVKKQKNGYGVYVTKNIILEGFWVGNKLSKGAELRSLSIYKGQFVNNKKHGEGECKWLNGEEYLGEWRNGYRHGQGCWSSKYGTQSYSGEWAQGKVTGYGQYFLKNFSVYKGFFDNFVKVGTGIEAFVNGDKYEGEYFGGLPNGKGKYTWECGLVYKGEFKNGQREGRGELIKQQIFELQGQFSCEKPHGICRVKFVNGDIFNGKFVYGVKYGFGAMQYYGSSVEESGFWYNDRLKERVSPQNFIYQTRCD